MPSRTSEHRVEVQVDQKCHCFRGTTKYIPTGSPESVLPEPLLRHTQVNCLLSVKEKQQYKDHLCLFRTKTRYSHGHITSTLIIHISCSQIVNQNLNTIRGIFVECQLIN